MKSKRFSTEDGAGKPAAKHELTRAIFTMTKLKLIAVIISNTA